MNGTRECREHETRKYNQEKQKQRKKENQDRKCERE
jgi:hypothetical protein